MSSTDPYVAHIVFLDRTTRDFRFSGRSATGNQVWFNSANGTSLEVNILAVQSIEIGPVDA